MGLFGPGKKAWGEQFGASPQIFQDIVNRAGTYQPGALGTAGLYQGAFNKAQGMISPATSYLSGFLNANPFESQAFQQTQNALFGQGGILTRALQGGAEQAQSMGLLGSGSAGITGRILGDVGNQFSSQALNAAMQSEANRLGAASTLGGLGLNLGQLGLSTASGITGVHQQNIANQLAALQTQLGAGGLLAGINPRMGQSGGGLGSFIGGLGSLGIGLFQQGGPLGKPFEAIIG